MMLCLSCGCMFCRSGDTFLHNAKRTVAVSDEIERNTICFG